MICLGMYIYTYNHIYIYIACIYYMYVYITLQILCVYAMTSSFFLEKNRIPVYVDMYVSISTWLFCVFSFAPFLILIWFWFILLYYYSLVACLFSKGRQKGGVDWMEVEVGRSWEGEGKAYLGYSVWEQRSIFNKKNNNNKNRNKREPSLDYIEQGAQCGLSSWLLTGKLVFSFPRLQHLPWCEVMLASLLLSIRF